jgi:hypothetical protein
MKRIAALMIAMAAGLPAADGPADAALAFLRGLSEENSIFAVGETAIAPEVTEADRADIAARLGRLARQLRPDDLEVLEEKQDGDLAAVLVSQVSDFDAATVQIHAVGLVKSAGKWLPAPLPSSFDRTGLSLRPGFLARAKALEEWMLRSRGSQLVRLKNDVVSLLVAEMNKATTPDHLHESKPAALAREFIDAVRQRNLPAALALTGGLEDPRPEGWEESFQTLAAVLRMTELRHPWWRLVAAPEPLRQVVHDDGDTDAPLVSVVGIDPAADFGSRPRPRALHFRFTRSTSGLWRLHLPAPLLSLTPPKRPPGREDDDDAVDGELHEMLPGSLREPFPAQPASEPLPAARALVEGLRASTLEALCPHLDLAAGGGRVALDGLIQAAALWQRIHQPDNPAVPLLLEVHPEGDDAVALVQIFSARSPEKASIETLLLRRGASGWLAHPAFSGSAALGSAERAAALGEWLKGAKERAETDWSASLLTRIGGIAADSAPTEEAAKELVERWRAAAATRDCARLLELSACFDDADGSTRLLRNIGHEIRSRQEGEILAAHRSGRWAAVSLRLPPAPGDDSADAYPLVVVAATPAGPRVLAELDLFDPLTRSREFLNRRVWDRVAARLPDGARGELESIYEKHRSLSAADRERRQKSTE